VHILWTIVLKVSLFSKKKKKKKKERKKKMEKGSIYNRRGHKIYQTTSPSRDEELKVVRSFFFGWFPPLKNKITCRCS
jgi:hypothetical protein